MNTLPLPVSALFSSRPSRLGGLTLLSANPAGEPEIRFTAKARRSRRKCRGFTFTEVLFAMLILGIGFIMLAAMFPVSLQQVQATAQDGAATAIGPQALRQIQWAINNGGAAGTSGGANSLPATGTAGNAGAVWSFRNNTNATTWQLWNDIRGNQISSMDPRFGWVAMYRRDAGDDFAQVFIIAAKCQNQTAQTYVAGNDLVRYSGGSVSDTSSNYPATLEPRLVQVSLNYASPCTASFTGTGSYDNTGAVASGCYVVIANDGGSGALNGHVYRISDTTATANTWSLVPGYDMASSSENILPAANATAYILGRGWTDPTNPGTYAGPAQDIGVYVGYVALY